MLPDEGIETEGISIDNIDGVLINGYFGDGSTLGPARVGPDGAVVALPVPAGLFGGAPATAMSRNGIAAGYYDDFSSGVQIKSVGWPSDVFTPLELPEGTKYAFPTGVGINGLVFGYASDGETGYSLPGFWALEIEQSFVESSAVSGALGETVELSAASFRSSGANAGYSVAVRVGGTLVGSAITDSSGIARLGYTIPAFVEGTQLSVVYTDETGASTTSVIDIESDCVVSDLNCDGSVNGIDLGALPDGRSPSPIARPRSRRASGPARREADSARPSCHGARAKSGSGPDTSSSRALTPRRWQVPAGAEAA